MGPEDNKPDNINPTAPGGAPAGTPDNPVAPSLDDTAAELAAAAASGDLEQGTTSGDDPLAPATNTFAGAETPDSVASGNAETPAPDAVMENAEDAEPEPLTPAEPLPGSIGSVRSGTPLPTADVPPAPATPAVEPAPAQAPEPAAAPESAATPVPTPESTSEPVPEPTPTTPEPAAPSTPEPTPAPMPEAPAPAPEHTPEPAPMPPAAPPAMPADPLAPVQSPLDHSAPTPPAPAPEPTTAVENPIAPPPVPQAKQRKLPLVPILIGVLSLLIIGIAIFFIIQANSQPKATTDNTPTAEIIQKTTLSCSMKADDSDLADLEGINAMSQEYIANYDDDELVEISRINNIEYSDASVAEQAVAKLEENYNTFIKDSLKLTTDPFKSTFRVDDDNNKIVIATYNAKATKLDENNGLLFDMVEGAEAESDTEETTSEIAGDSLAEPAGDTEATTDQPTSSDDTDKKDDEENKKPTLITEQKALRKNYEALGYTCKVTDRANK